MRRTEENMIRTKALVAVMLTTSMLSRCGANISDNSADEEALVVISETCTESSAISTTSPMNTTQATARTTTTTSTTTTSTTTTFATTETTEVTTATEPTTEPEWEYAELEQSVEPEISTVGTVGDLIYSGMRGTYYAPGSWNDYSAVGGSGRSLLDCNGGGDGYAKGSIASRYLYNLLGYYSNGGRTSVWLSVDEYPDMDGIYYLDDYSGADVIDFFYNADDNCQFCYAGVVSVDIYYVN